MNFTTSGAVNATVPKFCNIWHLETSESHDHVQSTSSIPRNLARWSMGPLPPCDLFKVVDSPVVPTSAQTSPPSLALSFINFRLPSFSACLQIPSDAAAAAAHLCRPSHEAANRLLGRQTSFSINPSFESLNLGFLFMTTTQRGFKMRVNLTPKQSI